MPKLLVLTGLPASGKTTLAKELVKKDGTYKRVNKDDLRGMVQDSWTGKKESFIVKVETSIIKEALTEGLNVVSDNTNLNPAHIERYKQLAKECKSEIEIRKITTDLQTCIERDIGRKNSVGETVIRQMHNKYLRPELNVVQDQSLPQVYLCDIDGTVALLNGRGPYEEDKVQNDLPNKDVIEVIRDLDRLARIIFLSGRTEGCKEKSIAWLRQHVLHDPVTEIEIYMRKVGDQRKDSIVKKELYDAHIRNKFYVRGVFDDRQQVVDLWRDLGFTCFQVADGRF